jgi:hypothetical protein
MSNTRRLLKEVKKKRTSSVVRRFNKELKKECCPYRKFLGWVLKKLKGGK